MKIVKITRGNRIENPDAPNNFIEEIKHLRNYVLERYGVLAGLKETKELIESIQSRQETDLEFQIIQLFQRLDIWYQAALIQKLKNSLGTLEGEK